MQIATKLPNENIQSYQLQMFYSGRGGGKLPNANCDQTTNSQLFQSFPTEVAQNDSEWHISPDSQLFQSFPTKVAQNDSEWPILPDLQLSQSFPTKVTQNDSEWPISPNLQLANLFPPKWLRMTRNGQFCLICTFPICSHQSGSELLGPAKFA